MSFQRSNLSQNTLREYLQLASSNGASTNPVHSRPWLAPVRQPPAPKPGLSTLQRLARERKEEFDLANRRDAKNNFQKRKIEEPAGGSAPPMFENPRKERRITKLSHTKGSSPAQLKKSRAEQILGTRVSPLKKSVPKLITLDDLHRAVLSVDLDNADDSIAKVEDDSLDAEMDELKLCYESLDEYKQRQSHVLLVESLEGYRQALSTGYSGTGTSLYSTVSVKLHSSVRKGRDWSLVTLKRESDDVVIRQGDVVLLMNRVEEGRREDSGTIDQILQYGFMSNNSVKLMASAGVTNPMLLGIAEKSKLSITSTKEPKTIQLKCPLVSKDFALGFSPAEFPVGTVWTAVVLHSLLTVEREWSALCALKDTAWFTGILLGRSDGKLHHRPSSASVVGLNSSQSIAVEAAADLDKGPPVVLLQGPPGTGKTKTISSLLQLYFSKKVKKIIVCAPSNAAIDELMSRLVRLLPRRGEGLILRVGRGAKPELQKYSLDTLVTEAQTKSEQQTYADYKKTKDGLIARINELSAEIQKQAGKPTGDLVRAKERIKASIDQLRDRTAASTKSTRDNMYKQLLGSAQFIMGTLSSFGSDPLVMNLAPPVDVCVIDEAAQSIEVSSLIPLRFCPRKIVLVGDPQQLPAVVKSAKARRMRFDMSLLERLQMIGHLPSFMLCEQYRMHPEIAHFPSEMFYEGLLETAPSVDRNVLNIHANIPPAPIMFINLAVAGDMRAGGSTSLINPREARLTADLVKLIHPSVSVGVITPYKNQVGLIRRLLGGSVSGNVEIDSVDAFQGREKDIVVFDCVRSGGDGKYSVGFLSDARRLNVAITRAKRALWIVGNAQFLHKNGGPVWAALVEYCQSLNRIVDGAEMERMIEETAMRID
jgi:hypothetical protein